MMHTLKELIKKTPTAYWWGASLLVVIFFVMALLPRGVAEVSPRYAPNVPLTALYSGESTDLSTLTRGKPAVINAWASWCPFCVHELPDLIALQRDFGEHITVVGINRNEPPEQARDYLSSIGADKGLVYVRDEGDLWYAANGGYVMPETIFLYADGRIAKHKRGPLSLEEMHHYVELLLENKPLAAPSTTPAIEHVQGCTEEGQCIF